MASAPLPLAGSALTRGLRQEFMTAWVTMFDDALSNIFLSDAPVSFDITSDPYEYYGQPPRPEINREYTWEREQRRVRSLQMTTNNENETGTSMLRKFGIEIEATHLTPSAANTALNNAGINSGASASHLGGSATCWTAKRDGSLPSGSCEVVSPPMTDLAQVKEVCRVMRRAGARVSRSCGVHVHIDVRDFSAEQMSRLGELWLAIQDHIFSLVPRSRRSSEWCRPNRRLVGNATQNNVCEIANRLSNNGRYWALNFASYRRHGSVEFRLHSSSLNGTKLTNWIQLCRAIVDYAASDAPLTASNWNTLTTTLIALTPATLNIVTTPAPLTAPSNTMPRRGTRKHLIWEALDRVYSYLPNVSRQQSSQLIDQVLRVLNITCPTRKQVADEVSKWRRCREGTPDPTAPAQTTRTIHPSYNGPELRCYFEERALELAA